MGWSNEVGVYVSAVTSEFGRARQEIARSLNAKRFEVQVQEEFEQGGETLLQKVHDSVKECQAMVAIVGTRSGAFPDAAEARPFADIVSAVGLEPGEYSYTEWELIFARHYRRRMFLFFAAPGYVPDRPTPEGDRPEVQARVVSWLRSQGWESREFTDVKDLQLAVLLSELDIVPGVRRSAAATDEGRDVMGSAGPGTRPRDPADAHRLPPNRHPIVGRDLELEELRDVIDDRYEQLVMVVGPAGIGKRALLQELANSDDLPTDFADGAGIHPLLGEGDGLEDMQQAIWSEFFVADDPSTVDPLRRRQDLRDLESLIFLPDIDSSVEHLPALLAGMPRSFFCISAQEESTRGLVGEEIPLDPLDDDAMIDLFEDRYGRAVADDLRPGLLQLCAGGNPGQIELLAKEARRESRRHRGDDDPLASWVVDRLGAGPAPSAAESDAAATATAVMAAIGSEVSREVLADVAGSSAALDEAIDDGRLEPG